MRIGEIKNFIKSQFSLPPYQRTPIFIWGAPGVGKSAAVKQAADELGIQFIDLRLGLLDPVDLRGVPKVEKREEEFWCIWSRPEFLPKDGDGILFLDELNVAVPSVQASAYQLVLDRAIGQHKLGDGWYIVAAGNRETDAAVTYRMPSPLRSRFIHINFDVNVDDWIVWALNQGIHESVIAFISYRPDLLLRFDPKSKEVNYPCPRTWEFVSRVLYSRHDGIYETLTGCIGEGAATEFLEFVKIRDKMPDVDKILDGSLTKLPLYSDTEKLGIHHCIISAILSRIALKKNKVISIDNALRFTMENMEPELNIMFLARLKTIAKTEVPKCSVFPDFVKKYREVVF